MPPPKPMRPKKRKRSSKVKEPACTSCHTLHKRIICAEHTQCSQCLAENDFGHFSTRQEDALCTFCRVMPGGAYNQNVVCANYYREHCEWLSLRDVKTRCKQAQIDSLSQRESKELAPSLSVIDQTQGQEGHLSDNGFQLRASGSDVPSDSPSARYNSQSEHDSDAGTHRSKYSVERALPEPRQLLTIRRTIAVTSGSPAANATITTAESASRGPGMEEEEALTSPHKPPQSTTIAHTETVNTEPPGGGGTAAAPPAPSDATVTGGAALLVQQLAARKAQASQERIEGADVLVSTPDALEAQDNIIASPSAAGGKVEETMTVKDKETKEIWKALALFKKQGGDLQNLDVTKLKAMVAQTLLQEAEAATTKTVSSPPDSAAHRVPLSGRKVIIKVNTRLNPNPSSEVSPTREAKRNEDKEARAKATQRANRARTPLLDPSTFGFTDPNVGFKAAANLRLVQLRAKQAAKLQLKRDKEANKARLSKPQESTRQGPPAQLGGTAQGRVPTLPVYVPSSDPSESEDEHNGGHSPPLKRHRTLFQSPAVRPGTYSPGQVSPPPMVQQPTPAAPRASGVGQLAPGVGSLMGGQSMLEPLQGLVQAFTKAMEPFTLPPAPFNGRAEVEEDLGPPAGYQLPPQQVPMASKELWTSLMPHKALPTMPLGPGKPLAKLNASLTKIEIAKRHGKMERYAERVREFMVNPARSTPWVMPEPVEVSSSSSSEEDDEEDTRSRYKVVKEAKLDGTGLPVLPSQAELLSRVMFAPHISSSSTYAPTVRVPKRDYTTMCQFNLDVAESEAYSLGAQEELGREIRGKRGKQLSAAKKVALRYQKLPAWKAAEKSVAGPRDALKCSFAVGSAAAAAAEATREATSELVSARTKLDAFYKNLMTLQDNAGGQLPQEWGLDPVSMYDALASIDRIERRLGIVDNATAYCGMAAEASTDSAARSIRHAVSDCRSIALCELLKSRPGNKASIVERKVLAQPYVPSSLFGGRLSISLDQLCDHQHEVTRHQRTVTQAGAGSLPLFDVNASILPQGSAGGSRRRPAGQGAAGQETDYVEAYPDTARPSRRRKPRNRGHGRESSRGQGWGQGGKQQQRAQPRTKPQQQQQQQQRQPAQQQPQQQKAPAPSKRREQKGKTTNPKGGGPGQRRK